MSNEDGKIYVGDVGTEIIIDMGSDISDATITTLKVKKSDKETTWAATIHDTNFLKYAIVADDLDVSGKYFIQPYLETPSWQGHGETVSFEVYELWR